MLISSKTSKRRKRERWKADEPIKLALKLAKTLNWNVNEIQKTWIAMKFKKYIYSRLQAST